MAAARIAAENRRLIMSLLWSARILRAVREHSAHTKFSANTNAEADARQCERERRRLTLECADLSALFHRQRDLPANASGSDPIQKRRRVAALQIYRAT